MLKRPAPTIDEVLAEAAHRLVYAPRRVARMQAALLETASTLDDELDGLIADLGGISALRREDGDAPYPRGSVRAHINALRQHIGNVRGQAALLIREDS